MIGNDELVRAGAGNEPAFERDAIVGREEDVFVFEADFIWVMEDG